jgi:hypothetical protein
LTEPKKIVIIDATGCNLQEKNKNLEAFLDPVFCVHILSIDIPVTLLIMIGL